jgi:hypothetical protein
MNSHIHHYKIDSKTKKGHKHKIYGYADTMVGTAKFHFHFFYGVSAYADHTHYYSGITGMPFKTSNGHIHKMEGLLESNELHEHLFWGHTFEEISYIPGKAYCRNYV